MHTPNNADTDISSSILKLIKYMLFPRLSSRHAGGSGGGEYSKSLEEVLVRQYQELCGGGAPVPTSLNRHRESIKFCQTAVHYPIDLPCTNQWKTPSTQDY